MILSACRVTDLGFAVNPQTFVIDSNKVCNSAWEGMQNIQVKLRRCWAEAPTRGARTKELGKPESFARGDQPFANGILYNLSSIVKL